MILLRLDEAEASRRGLVVTVFAGTVWSGSGPWQLDVLECEDFGELVEVCVAMEHGNAAVLGSRRGDQGVGQRHTMIPVAVLGQLAERAHSGVGVGAVVA
jgi:hypothetical protein